MPDHHINILLVEDTETDAAITERALKTSMRSPYSVVRAHSMAEVESILRSRDNFDVILLDLGLPDTNGRIDTFQRLERAKTRDIPTLVLSSIVDRELAVSIVGHGAEDYVRKSRLSIEPQSISDAIDFAMSRHKNEEEIKRKKDKARAEKEEVLQWMGGSYSCQK